MRRAKVYVNKKIAGHLEEMPENKYVFLYEKEYAGAPISLNMPVTQNKHEFDFFPPFFEGLLPEGALLEGLLRKYKLDKNDYFGQLLIVGKDVVGAVSIEEDKAT